MFRIFSRTFATTSRRLLKQSIFLMICWIKIIYNKLKGGKLYFFNFLNIKSGNYNLKKRFSGTCSAEKCFHQIVLIEKKFEIN